MYYNETKERDERFTMIKNIIFDVGNVLLDYRCQEMLVSYGLTENEAKELTDLMFGDKLWRELDLVGKEEEPRIVEDYKKKFPEYADAIQWFMTHFGNMHVPRKEIWELVHQLKIKGFHLYFLSNYPETMFEMHTKDASFMADMDGGVVSYQIHKSKPDPEIYQHLLRTYHLAPDECLFFDDLSANTGAAAKLGIHTVTVTSKEFLAEKLRELIRG